MKIVTVTEQALISILSLPIWNEGNICYLNVGDRLEVTGLVTRIGNNEDYIQLKYGENEFYVKASLFDFDIEAYKEERRLKAEEESKKRLLEKREKERQEILEHYDWNDLRCKAAVAAMQGVIINGVEDKGDGEENIKFLVSTSVKVANALIKELQETV